MTAANKYLDTIKFLQILPTSLKSAAAEAVVVPVLGTASISPEAALLSALPWLWYSSRLSRADLRTCRDLRDSRLSRVSSTELAKGGAMATLWSVYGHVTASRWSPVTRVTHEWPLSAGHWAVTACSCQETTVRRCVDISAYLCVDIYYLLSTIYTAAAGQLARTIVRSADCSAAQCPVTAGN